MLNSLAPMSRLVVVLQALADVQTVYVGIPESIDPQVVAYIALAGQRYIDKMPGMQQREANYFVAFAYAVSGAEAGAETTLAAAVDAFAVALMAERRTNLAGTCDALDWDFSLGDQPQYAPFAAREFRLLPVLVTVTQQQPY